MSATLQQLVAGLGARTRGPADLPLDDVCYDSREVRPGALFVALRGAASDGHRFIDAAIASGARALVVESLPPDEHAEIGIAAVRDTRAVLPEIARRFFGDPGADLTLIGVTGTNGKTSVTRMVEAILTAAGRTAGSIGTISIRHPGFEAPAMLTTPESVDLHRTLARMRDAGVDAVAMEVSSHSLSMDRVRGLHFAVGVFTHLSQDHLDFHGDMDAYAAAKGRLFSGDLLAGTAVLNARDPHSVGFAETARAAGRRVMTFARGDTGADISTVHEEADLGGARLRVRDSDGEHEVVLPLPGDFQIENALAAMTAARALGIDWNEIVSGLARCPAIPGRLERVGEGSPVVLVDYAHTHDALDRVLACVRPLASGELIAVFGCGGDRDRTKRAPMARAACKNADLAIATSDNPRTEDPAAILSDVSEGLSGRFEVVPDRRAAIRRAVAVACDGDVVVIAGKGHEDYQIIGREKRPFDDRVEARAALAERRSA